MPAGRKPKPTHLKVLEGNPGKRALPQGEPKPKVKRPPVPKHLNKVARREWNRIVKLLLAAKLVTELDRAALAAYCQAWANWVEASERVEALKATGQLVTMTENGYPVASPWLGIQKRASDEMRQYLTEFGLTPSSRTKVSVIEEPERDDYGQFLSRRRSGTS